MPILEFTYQLHTFRVVGVRRTETGWEHSIINLDTGECKWKTDEWLKHALIYNHSKLE